MFTEANYISRYNFFYNFLFATLEKVVREYLLGMFLLFQSIFVSVKLCQEVPDPDTLWPKAAPLICTAEWEAFFSGSQKEEEVGGEVTTCGATLSVSGPSFQRLSHHILKLQFLSKWTRSATACGFCTVEGRKRGVFKGLGPTRCSGGYGSDSRVCRVSDGERWVCVVPPLASLANIPLSLPRMCAHFVLSCFNFSPV